MEEGSCGEQSEDDKVLPNTNKKRMVKTHAQIEALEKFYDAHKYPSEPMKVQLAESIGLTDKQVSGWFRNRRLKDKRLQKGETCLIERQDHSSGVVQDRGSGLRQDSCGSTKLGDDRNFDTREVESGRLNLPEFSAADLTNQQRRHYKVNNSRMDDETSGSNSSLRNMSFHNTDPSDVASSAYLIPKFPVEVKDLKARSGPSGYLNVKDRLEKSVITAVKRQLGRHYQEGGPPLGVDFDPLPPGAFESPMQNTVDETNYSGEPVLPISPDVSKNTQNPRFHKRSFSVEFPESSDKDISASESRNSYLMKSKQGVEGVRTGSFLNRHQPQPYSGNLEEEQEEFCVHRSNDLRPDMLQREDIVEEPSYMANKWNDYRNFGDKALPPKFIKDDKFYNEKRILNESVPHQFKIPLKNEMPAPKKGGFHNQQQYHQRSLLVHNTPTSTTQVMRSRAEISSGSGEDDGSTETSSSVD